VSAVYRLSLPRALLNVLVRPLIRCGLGGSMAVLTAPGRVSGRPYSTPVKVVERGGERWLVAPYGERSWVKNARAAGAVELRRSGRTEELRVVAVAPEEAAPVLRDYLRSTPVTQRFFDVTGDSTLAEFTAEASRHPVFRLEPL
jgi:deazaflavin-dependent oxidoreductase (nitroreductase family)